MILVDFTAIIPRQSLTAFTPPITAITSLLQGQRTIYYASLYPLGLLRTYSDAAFDRSIMRDK